MEYQLGPPPMNPLSRLLAAVVGAIALVGAFFFGFFVLVAAIVIGLVAGLVIWLRIWWIRRKLSGSGAVPPPGFEDAGPQGGGGTARGGDVIEAEYEVVSRQEGRDDEAK